MELSNGDIMWNDFSDVELIDLCHTYGIEEELVVLGNNLINREEIEKRLTAVEYDLSFNEPVTI
jgi:hypothetical protein